MSEADTRKFASRASLDQQLAKDVAQTLREAIAKRGKASIVVSGGSTPKGFFAALAQETLDWEQLTVALADDRWVPEEHRDSNERLVKELLLSHAASAAKFLSLTTSDAHPRSAVGEITERFSELGTVDVVILGMGGDGHFASLFPDSNTLELGLDMHSGQTFIAVDPPAAPHTRMSMTLPRILDAQRVMLHIVGEDKRTVLERAISEANPLELPIAALFAARRPSVETYWAP